MLGTLNVSIGCRSVAGVRGQRNSDGSAGRHGKEEVSTGWRITICVRKSKLRILCTQDSPIGSKQSGIASDRASCDVLFGMRMRQLRTVCHCVITCSDGILMQKEGRYLKMTSYKKLVTTVLMVQ
jgi:hypothetical protein